MEPNTVENGEFQIKAGRAEDCQRVFDLIMELAIYEKLESLVVGNADMLRQWAFGENKVIYINCGWLNGEIIGYSLHFLNFSTFLCRPGIYLEDIYVQPAYRGRKYGKALLLNLCKIAKEKGYGRVEWQVLDWNAPSIKFYESLGAKPQKEWIQYRLIQEQFDKLAKDFDENKY
ncbi:GCN5-related N-acetyltransferase [Tieghemostelium lacteum]|uniref:GCN5-related N-acetyltransferase n=1 Tax=Tieghemostelium lacteum TaxID=361077 RepID=A0A152A975_TIELA|nr:GCN5-related N-acetyltransferase [Tieghemostelium lacteum]|eukprot:KYR02617.1 GCN5-related N-acetyltransferase [Tieghemostelium lacteum]